jgi:hypothetical protein
VRRSGQVARNKRGGDICSVFRQPNVIPPHFVYRVDIIRASGLRIDWPSASKIDPMSGHLSCCLHAWTRRPVGAHLVADREWDRGAETRGKEPCNIEDVMLR